MKALLVAAAIPLLAAAAQSPTNVVPIHLYSYGFAPSPISLRAGVPVTLVFTNDAGKGHEFKAPEFFHAAHVVSGQVEEEGAIELKPRQSMSVTLVPARGTYAVHCGHFMHTQLGMHSVIYVQ